MNKSNTPPFYVGEEVECVISGANGLVKGQNYIVTAVLRDSCGCYGVLVNNGMGGGIMESGECTICNSKLINAYNTYLPSNFRRLQRPKPMTFLKLADIQEQEKEEILTLQ